MALLYRNAQSRVLEHALFSANPSTAFMAVYDFAAEVSATRPVYMRLMANANDDTPALLRAD
jgi:hypothetical protein